MWQQWFRWVLWYSSDPIKDERQRRDKRKWFGTSGQQLAALCQSLRRKVGKGDDKSSDLLQQHFPFSRCWKWKRWLCSTAAAAAVNHQHTHDSYANVWVSGSSARQTDTSSMSSRLCHWQCHLSLEIGDGLFCAEGLCLVVALALGKQDHHSPPLFFREERGGGSRHQRWNQSQTCVWQLWTFGSALNLDRNNMVRQQSQFFPVFVSQTLKLVLN